MTDRAALTVDVELFSQTPAYRAAEGATDREGIGLEGLAFLRAALARHEARSTCFVVSELAEEYPGAIRELAADGHEIGSHTHTHRLLTDLSPAERESELVRSKARLESTTGASVAGFRAPAFDVGPEHFHALRAAGYEYDASVVPARSIPGWYGGTVDRHRPAPAAAIEATAPADLAVVPTSVMPGLGLPLTGAWLRFFGPRYTILGMRWLARRGISPVLYVHPWELVELPDVEGVPRRVTVRTGAWMRRAVERILATPVEFVALTDLLRETGLDGGV